MVIKCWSPDHNMIIIWSHHNHDHQVLITWSNLVPVAIAVQRYLLVCRAVFCHSVGGKKIWKYIHSAVILLGTLCGTAFVFERDSSLTFLRCMGQEEKFWSVPILRIIADSAQTEYCTTFHFPYVCQSQAWHLNFSQLFDYLGHENHIFSESISSRVATLTTLTTWPPGPSWLVTWSFGP